MDNREKVESVGTFIQCGGGGEGCHGGVLFVIGPKEKPDKIYLRNIPIALCEKFVGVKAKCNRCGRTNRAFMNYHSLPIMLCAVAEGDIDVNET